MYVGVVSAAAWMYVFTQRTVWIAGLANLANVEGEDIIIGCGLGLFAEQFIFTMGPLFLFFVPCSVTSCSAGKDKKDKKKKNQSKNRHGETKETRKDVKNSPKIHKPDQPGTAWGKGRQRTK
ncbi:hypothetical protein Tco_0963889 [Tanacetum coccineum]